MKLAALNKIPPFILAASIIILLGIYVRAAGLGTHFGHLDDLGVAVTLLQYKETDRLDYDFFKKNLIEKEDPPTQEKVKTFDFNQYRFGSEVKKLVGLERLRKWDALGYLHPLVDSLNGILRSVSVPLQWTYAPLQFFLTDLLISKNQSYREILFWGRFPAFLFSICGLWGMVLFYKKYRPLNSSAGLLAIALLAFSWENIIYAKQMGNYALGVFAAIALLILLLHNFEKRDFSPWLNGFLLALLSYAHYQVLFFIPAFYITLFIYHRSCDQAGFKGTSFKRIVYSAAFCIVLIVPMYLAFLSRRASQGINAWNRGASGEFLYSWDSKVPFIESFAHSLYFYLKNFMLVLNSNLTFMPEFSVEAHFSYYFFGFLFIVGVFSFMTENEKVKKGLSVFLLTAGVIWCGLIAFGKLTFSPTRHSLILLPFMCIVVAEGFSYLCEKANRILNRDITFPAQIFLTALIAILYFNFFPKVMAERRDPFEEKRILSILNQYDVKTIMAYSGTLNVSLMPSVAGRFQYLDERFRLDRGSNSEFKEPGSTLALISHRDKLSPYVLERLRELLQRELDVSVDFSSYHIIHSEEKESDVEVEFSNKTKNGTNGFFFYVLTNQPAV